MILIIFIFLVAALNHNFNLFECFIRRLFSDNIIYISPFQILATMSLEKNRRSRWRKIVEVALCCALRPASAARFAPATTRVRPSCGLPLGAIIQGGSLSAFTLLACAYIYVCINVCVHARAYTRVMYASSEQIQARAGHFRCSRLLHTVCSSRRARVLLHS